MSIKNNTNFKKCAHKCTLTYAIMVSDELEITNAFHTYFPIKAIYNVAPQHCLCTSRVGINVADVNKKIGIKLIKPPCNRYKRRVWIANSPREKVIAYPDDCCAVRKATLTTSERPAYLVRYQGTNHLGT